MPRKVSPANHARDGYIVAMFTQQTRVARRRGRKEEGQRERGTGDSAGREGKYLHDDPRKFARACGGNFATDVETGISIRMARVDTSVFPAKFRTNHSVPRKLFTAARLRQCPIQRERSSIRANGLCSGIFRAISSCFLESTEMSMQTGLSYAPLLSCYLYIVEYKR